MVRLGGEEMKEWQKELREELQSRLVADTDDGRETQVEVDFDPQAGALALQWKDAENRQWGMAIPHAMLVAVMDAMAKRLYPTARSKRRTKGTGRGARSRE
jgi:hypothetical protein